MLCDPDHAPFRDFLSVGWDLLCSAYIPNLSTGAPVTNIWKAAHNVKNGVVWRGYGGRQCHHSISTYDFLFNWNRNYASILQRFRGIASYLSKFVDFNPPHLHLAPSIRGPRSNFAERFGTRKLETLGYWCDTVSMILGSTILAELRLVTVGQADGQRAISYTVIIFYAALA